MSAPSPIIFQWSGAEMIPAPGFRKRCDEQFVVGERYQLEVRESRSSASHRHLFACINEAWSNLPDNLAEQFASADHLRRYALIRCGFRDERKIVCPSKAEAQKVAAFVRPLDEYAVVFTEGAVVTVATAKSQSMKAMPKAEFQASKDAVLDYIATLIGTEAKALEQHASEAA